jgi:hypothetical protein
MTAVVMVMTAVVMVRLEEPDPLFRSAETEKREMPPGIERSRRGRRGLVVGCGKGSALRKP